MRWQNFFKLVNRPWVGVILALGLNLSAQAALPLEPTQLTVVPGNTSLGITWMPPANASAIAAYRIEQDGVIVGNLVSPPTPISPAYTLEALTNGRFYTLRVWGVDAGGNSAVSAARMAAPAVFPHPPKDFLVQRSGASVQLTWSPGITETFPVAGYFIERSPTGTALADPVMIFQGNALSFLDTALNTVSANALYYRISTWDSVGNTGPASAWVMADLRSVVRPALPEGLSVVPGDGHLSLNWSPVDGADAYAVYFTTQPGTNLDPHLLSVASTTVDLLGLTNGVAYTLYVAAVADGVLSERASLQAMPTAAPAGVSGFQTYAGNAYVRLSWTAPNDTVTGYTVLRDTVSPPGTTLAALSATELVYQDTSALNEVTYFYAVVPGNATGLGAAALTGPLTPHANAVPDQAGGFSTQVGTSGTILLTWNAALPNDSLAQWVLDTPSGVLTLPGSTVSMSLEQGLVNGTLYHLTLTAQNSQGLSAKISVQAAPFAAPLGLSVRASGNAALLNWTLGATPAGAYYVLERVNLSSGVPVSVTQTTWSGYLDAPLPNGTYRYRLSSASLTTDQPAAQALTREALVTIAVPPAPPERVNLISGNQQVFIYWKKVTGTQTYNLYRSTTAGAYSQPLVSDIEETATQWIDKQDVLNLTRYYYTLTAVNEAGESTRSAEASVMPFVPARLPAETTVKFFKDRQEVTLSWVASLPGDFPLAGYNLYRSEDGGSHYQLLGVSPTVEVGSLTITAYQYTDRAIHYGQAYFYRVHAVDDQGQEGPAYSQVRVVLEEATNSLYVRRNAFRPAQGERAPVQIMLLQPGRVWIKIYTLSGRYVLTLFDQDIQGPYSYDNPYFSEVIFWDGRNHLGQMAASGVYLIHAQGPGQYQQSRKIALIK